MARKQTTAAHPSIPKSDSLLSWDSISSNLSLSDIKNVDRAIFVTQLLIWALCWAVCVQLEFGLVFFSFSLIAFILLTLGRRQSKQELSAYSVFNPDCQRLPGTFSGEHVDKGIRMQL